MHIRRENSAISHLAETDLKKSLQIIHQTVVQDAIESYKCVVLGGRPIPDDKSEKQLPRPTSCTLSQLRSGISMYLNSYLSILTPEVVDTCPHCGASPHITRHLFDCAFRHTDLFLFSFLLLSFYTCTSYSGYNNNNKRQISSFTCKQTVTCIKCYQRQALTAKFSLFQVLIITAQPLMIPFHGQYLI